MKRVTVASIRAAFVIALLTGQDLAWSRTWTDKTGEYQIEADLVEIRGETVVLRKADGSTIKVLLDKLGDKDRRFIASVRAAQRRKAETDKPNNSTNPTLPSDTKPEPADADCDDRLEAKANSRYAFLVTPAKKVKAEIAFTVVAPNLEAKEWILYAANPPQLTGQSIRTTFAPNGKAVQDSSNSQCSLLLARVPVTEPALQKQITAKIEIEAQLFERRLVPRSENVKVGKVQQLDESERASYLQETPLIDFTSQGFQDWLDRQSLRRAVPESQVDYARRVFSTIRKNFTYSYTSKMDRQASHICRAGTSDCGGLAIAFAAALRAHRVPCRLNVGRWAKSASKGETVGEIPYFQQHAKAEFYADGVGWVPVDVSSGVLHDKSPQGLQYFGHDKGDFITMHVDHDLSVDTFYFGQKTVRWMQGVSYWVTGAGSLNDSSIQEDWRVR